ncbi:MAG: enoyl-CoA hydratase/isomerase family protein [Alphaproteobacteria bacterium]|jgi:enoyl-CoA hydratase
MTNSSEIQFSVDGPVGRIHLTKEKKLNSLTQAMCLGMHEHLTKWATDDAVHAVVVTAEGQRAFCAGGDVIQVSTAGQKDPVAAREFFHVEYAMDLAIAEFPKPYICLIDGIVMGGGVGISVNGRYRVMSEHIMAAMPETGIGLLPDVGATSFLNKCPGRIGLYLGLTGARLDAADSLYARFATHLVSRDKQPALLEALIAADYGDDKFAAVDALLAGFSDAPGPSKLQDRHAEIDRLFADNDVEKIVAALEAEGSELANESLKAFTHMSPTSLKLAAKQITDNPGISVKDALILEHRLISQVLLRHEFYEGIRAALIDKDRSPKWQPATLAEVTPEYIDAHFENLGDGELVLD